MRLTALILSALAPLVLAACVDDGDPMTDGWDGGIPDGTYRCERPTDGGSATVGDIQIEGAHYGGFSAGWRGAYSVADDGSVEFSEDFEGMPEGRTVERATWTTNPDPVLEIHMSGGDGERLVCRPVTT